MDFFQTTFQKTFSQKKVTFQMQFLSHVKKRKGKLSFFQKNVSEKKLGGGQLSAAEKYLRASVTY
jgi:hypothetical protein